MSAAPNEDFATRRLYLCTPDRPDLERFVASCIEGGVDVVQLREKELEAKALIARAQLLTRVCADFGVPFVMNDRPDIARYVEANGVHVGQDDVPATLARELLGPDAIVGLSTHGIEDLQGAQSQPIDYISAGPIVATPTKPGRPGTGLDYLSKATRHASSWRTAKGANVPVFVTGGVTPETVPAIAGAGAAHFVVVRYLTEADDPQAAARLLRNAIDDALEVHEATRT